MTLDEYQRAAYTTASIEWDDPKGRHIPLFGAVGELGSLVAELKKSIRDGEAYTDINQNLNEEIGDLLWYLAAIASRLGCSLQDLAKATKKQGKVDPFFHIYRLIGAVADLANVLNSAQQLTTAERHKAITFLRSAVQSVMHVAHRDNLDIQKILRANLKKGRGMFGNSNAGPARCFDAAFPGYERLPRKMHIQFLERHRGQGRVEVVLRVNDLNIGDRLTDNARKDDGYRFHDAFHLGYVAVLGWSPVVRATFRCKRKSDSRIDEIEDGARAAVVEEAIAQTIFNYARGHSMLKGFHQVDHGILKLAQRMARGLEVEKCAMHEWQRAILVGFSAFRDLRDHHGGWLTIDSETQSLNYSREGPGSF